MFAANVAILLRVHRRVTYLEPIFKQAKRLLQGRRGHIFVRCDNASSEVLGELERLGSKLPAHIQLTTFAAAAPARSDGQAWSQSCAELFDKANATDRFDAGMLWDDDVLFSTTALSHLRKYFDTMRADRVEMEALNIWDKDGQYNEAFPPHWAAVAFRWYPYDEWDDEMIVRHCPRRVGDSRHYYKVEKAKAYHFGYKEPDDRLTAWNNAKFSGKIDAHTIALIEEPRLKKIYG